MYSGDGVSVPALMLTLCIMVSLVLHIAVWISGLLFEYGGLGLGFSIGILYAYGFLKSM